MPSFAFLAPLPGFLVSSPWHEALVNKSMLSAIFFATSNTAMKRNAGTKHLVTLKFAVLQVERARQESEISIALTVLRQ